MKRLIRKISYLSLLGAMLTACTSDFAEINTNPLALDTGALEESQVLQGQAFAQAQYVAVNGLHWRFQISQEFVF